MKTCTKCGIEKTLDDFHRWKQSKDGRKSRCKACNTADSSAWQVANKERYLTRYKEWAEKNRDKTRANSKNWNARNRGFHHVRQKELHGQEAVNKRSRTWATKNRQRARAIKSAWKKKNLDWLCASAAKRRAALLMAIPTWADFNVVRSIYQEAKKQAGMHVDHIVPLISPLVCGLHWEGNLRIIPDVENYSKNNRYWPDMP